MKILLVYYSRTGTTKNLAEFISKKIGAETEEIKDKVNRRGIIGYLLAGRDGMKHRLTELEPLKSDPSGYDLVVIGTPIWAGNLSAPARTYLNNFKGRFNQVAFFCSMGSRGADVAFKQMEEIAGKKPLATVSFNSKEFKAGDFSKAEKFCALVKG